ncbi:hypothetical protein F0L68_37915 [Solihabitans fulvus]|uniref:Uncharacterized protein n=1 Tax=Solihabitans fulvus TaxID=1892852 RepID=A0A5B2WGG9_9PSEU|nr:hypothetical protein [Solihabitans fulvus]KAA2251203.1 hypothetical protein F0L68_37915 [Solihabitans fulvus]
MSTADAMLDGGNNADAVGKTVGNNYNGKDYGDRFIDLQPGPFGNAGKIYRDLTPASGGVNMAATITDVGAFTASCTDAISKIAADPLNWLIGQGLGFLINICTPIKQAIDLVSGNPDALTDAAKKFGTVGKDIEKLNTDMANALKTELADWHGPSADAAQERLGKFAEGVAGVAGRAGDIAQLLQVCSMLMQVIEDFIKGLLTDLVEWLIVTWVAALAAAPVTLGGSTAAASGVTAVKAATTTAKVTQKVSKFTTLLNKIRAVLAKLKEFLRSSKAVTKFMGEKGAGRKALEGVRKAAGEGKHAKVGVGDAVKNQLGAKVKDSAKKRAAEQIGLTHDPEKGFKIPTIKNGDQERNDYSKIAGKVKTYGDNSKKIYDYGQIGEDRINGTISGDLNL